jgi:hypothetical protein
MLTEAELIPFYESAERYADPGQPGDLNHKPRPLYPLELELIRCMVRGHAAMPISEDGASFDEARPDEMETSLRCIVRASVIRWACTDKAFQLHVDPIGLFLQGAMIEGELNMQFVELTYAFGLLRCRVTQKMFLMGLQAKRIDFSGSSMSSISLDHAKILTNLTLNNDGRYRFEARGEVHLVGAAIGGLFDCRGASFSNSGGVCICFDGATINGGVIFAATEQYRFEAQGKVRFRSAIIGGSLECSGASLSNAGGECLEFDGAKIEGNVALSVSGAHRFEAKGEVRFLNTTIGGSLECSGASFSNAGGNCLSFDGATIERAVVLAANTEHRFQAEGMVRFPGASIGVQLNCSGASFSNAGGYCLSFDCARINGNVGLFANQAHRFEARGEVRFPGAFIAGEVNCGGASFSNACGQCLRFDGATIERNVWLDVYEHHPFESRGQVSFLNATIGGSLDCSGALFSNASGVCLNFDGANIKGSVVLCAKDKHRFQALGNVRFLGATIGGQLSCIGARFSNAGNVCFVSDGATINGSVFFGVDEEHRFEAKGQMRFLGASLGGSVDFAGTLLSNPGGECLSFDAAKIRGDVFFRARKDYSFEAEGLIRFTGTTIEGAFECRGAVFTNGQGGCVNCRGVTIHDFTKFHNVQFTQEVGIAGIPEMSTTKPTATSESTLNLDSAQFLRRLTLHNVRFNNANLSLKHANIGHLDDVNQDGSLGVQGLPQGGLRLDGLVYRKIAELKRIPDSTSSNGWLAHRWHDLRMILGRSAEGQARSEWLRLQRPPQQSPSFLARLWRLLHKSQSNFRPQPYEQLASALFVAGREDAAKAVQLNKLADRAATRGCFPRLWCWFLRRTIGNGYYVHYAVYPLLSLLFLGAGMFWTLSTSIRVTDGDILMQTVLSGSRVANVPLASPDCPAVAQVAPGYVVFNAFVFSLDALTPIIDLGQVSAWRPHAGWALWYFWIHRILGAILFGLVLTGIGQTIVRRNPAADSN